MLSLEGCGARIYTWVKSGLLIFSEHVSPHAEAGFCVGTESALLAGILGEDAVVHDLVALAELYGLFCM